MRWSGYTTGCALLLCLAYVPPRREAAIKRLRAVVCCGQYYYPLLDKKRIAASHFAGVCPMTASRLFDTGSGLTPAVHAWDAQASAAGMACAGTEDERSQRGPVGGGASRRPAARPHLAPGRSHEGVPGLPHGATRTCLPPGEQCRTWGSSTAQPNAAARSCSQRGG